MLDTNIYKDLAANWGISSETLIILLAVITIWDLAWRCVAVWKSTKENKPVWSIVFVLFQTIGILPILYIFVFSKMKSQDVPVQIAKPRRKSRRKRK
jgi:hypothetical protein